MSVRNKLDCFSVASISNLVQRLQVWSEPDFGEANFQVLHSVVVSLEH